MRRVRPSEPLPVDANDVAARRTAGPGHRSARWPTTGSLTVAGAGGGAVQLSRDLDEVHHVLARCGSASPSIGVVVTVLAALVGWLIARRSRAR